MRYAIYWLPDKSSDLYHMGQDWFEQVGEFLKYIEIYKETLTFLDFSLAFNIIKKYGFHAEIVPPFYLKNKYSEADIFNICKKIAKTFTRCDLKLSLQKDNQIHVLRSDYKNNVIIKLKDNLKSALLPFIEKEDDFCKDDFFIVLSNTSDKKLHDDVEIIAKDFWQHILKNTIEINHFNLCYQIEKNAPFQELMRFDFKAL
jgi:hypothetical protein